MALIGSYQTPPFYRRIHSNFHIYWIGKRSEILKKLKIRNIVKIKLVVKLIKNDNHKYVMPNCMNIALTKGYLHVVEEGNCVVY